MTQNEAFSNATLKPMSRRSKEPIATRLAAGLSFGSGLMLGAALPGLLEPATALDWGKIVLIGLTGAGVSYGTTRLAVEKGTLQAALGAPGAGLVSVASIVVVGAGMFGATYAGFTRSEVDQLRLQEFASEYADYVDIAQAEARRSMDAVPLVRAITSDLTATAQCEFDAGCLNESGIGGTGPVYREAQLKSLAAAAVLSEVERSGRDVSVALEALADKQADFTDALDDPSLSSNQRRAALQADMSEISRLLTQLEQSAPTATLQGFAAQLASGANIPDRDRASANLSAIMQRHAGALGAAIVREDTIDVSRPHLPAKTGVTDTFAWMGHFLPLAMIVAVIELIFPLCLWFYTFTTLLGRVQQENPREPDDPDPNSFESLVTLPPARLVQEVEAKRVQQASARR
ncbi:hypothetical protein [Pseudoroseicyclus sp. CXY001]|uniref:hypothetical protein n=1 Tax=Pseudoroseicyclus sp. CXY001 TaxID=3242492 RepID=UPI0035709E09